MTDPTTAPAKPIWTRCKGPEGKGNGCGQRVFNDRIDIERHRQHCPADLERVVDKLEKRIEKLEHVEIVIPEQVDLNDVSDDWPTDGAQPAYFAFGDEPSSPLTIDEPVPTVDLRGGDIEDEDEDEDDDEPTAPTIGSSLYTPAALT